MTPAVPHPLFTCPIVIVGSGNMAWHWPRILMAGCRKVDYFYARNGVEGEALARSFGGQAITSPDDISPLEQCLVILAVSDSAIPAMAGEWLAAGHTVIHGSGSVSSKVCGENGGVCYPLQTFTKGREVEISNIPFYLTTSNTNLLRVLQDIIGQTGASSSEITDERRQQLHLAAVMVNNFTNHLVALALRYLDDGNTTKNPFVPLLRETVSKLEALGPEKAQTGPASRGDMATIEKHVQMLENHPDIQAVYRLLTNSLRQSSEEH